MENYKQYYSKSFAADPSLRFTEHSHGRWPDAAVEGHIEAATKALHYADDKWMEWVFGEIIPKARTHAARLIGLTDADAERIAFGPNTHHLLFQVLSRLLVEKPMKLHILTTDSEFESFDSQIRELEKLETVSVERIPLHPRLTFAERFCFALAGGPLGSSAYDLAFLSHTFFDSGFSSIRLPSLVKYAPEKTILMADGSHSVGAMPVSIEDVKSRVFYLWTSYKYGMGGEGASFMHIPEGNTLTPLFTGWMKDIESVIAGKESASTHAFWPATFDPTGLSRFVAVNRWMEEIGMTIAKKADYTRSLQQMFMINRIGKEESVFHFPAGDSHGLLSFLAKNEGCAKHVEKTLREHDIPVDTRDPYVRIGFGLYHSEEDVDWLLEVINRCNL